MNNLIQKMMLSEQLEELLDSSAAYVNDDRSQTSHSAEVLSLDTDYSFDGVMTASQLHLFNCRAFLEIIKSQRQGLTCLPYNLGLSEQNLTHFKNAIYVFLGRRENDHQVYKNLFHSLGDSDDLRQSLLEMRLDEWQEIKELILLEATIKDPSVEWMAEIVAAGCMGGDHLWRDLGLPNRTMLGDLLLNNFYALASKNTKDMKWKKFFYKQLCEREGGYVCRSPSCEQCAAYQECFGPEE